MDFEKVALAASTGSRAAEHQTDMVLQGELVSMDTPRMVSYALGRYPLANPG